MEHAALWNRPVLPLQRSLRRNRLACLSILLELPSRGNHVRERTYMPTLVDVLQQR